MSFECFFFLKVLWAILLVGVVGNVITLMTVVIAVGGGALTWLLLSL